MESQRPALVLFSSGRLCVVTGLSEWDCDACTSNCTDKSLKSFLPAHWQHMEKALERPEGECMTSAEAAASWAPGSEVGRPCCLFRVGGGAAGRGGDGRVFC